MDGPPLEAQIPHPRPLRPNSIDYNDSALPCRGGALHNVEADS